VEFTGENLLRELAPQVLGAVVRRFGDFAAAEDAVQEALLATALQWPEEGMPDNPRGWLIHVAARRMTDHLRAELARRRREAIVVMQAPLEERVVPAPDAATATDQDDTLLLLFMCCHPALTRSSAIALTLRAVGGLTTGEIASAFFVPEATMAQRISRAKQRIKTSGIPFRMPTDRERTERLSTVLHVLYLIFNEGYTSSGGPALHRSDLSNEAIRLTRSMTFKTRFDFPASLSPSIRPSVLGTICHDNPNLSFSQPHRLGAPPSAMSFVHNSSISSCVSHPTKNEMASVNVYSGPAFNAMNDWPSSSNCTDITFPCARLMEMTFERLKIEA
jgi:RNA polymerase sigma factor (sigma-70 family)